MKSKLIGSSLSPLINFTVIVFLCLFLVDSSRAQTTEEYFTKPGLKIFAYYLSWQGPSRYEYFVYSGSQTHNYKKIHEYYNPKDKGKMYLYFEKDKMYYYQISSDAKSLIFDFGLKVGDIINHGIYYGSRVDSINDIHLLNGEVRKVHVLVHDDKNVVGRMVPGIGNLNGGLFPNFNHEGYSILICVQENDDFVFNFEGFSVECDTINCVPPFPDFKVFVEDKVVKIENNSKFANDFNIDFGDGSTSSVLVNQYEYQSPGCYRISITSKNDCSELIKTNHYYVSLCDSDQWTETNHETKDKSSKIYVYDENTIFKYGEGFLDKSVDSGVTFENFKLLDNQNKPVKAVKLQMFDESNGILIAHKFTSVNAYSIFVTFDGAKSWEQTYTGYINSNRVFFNNQGEVNLSTGHLEYLKSNNFGYTWEKVKSNQYVIHTFEYMAEDTIIARVVSVNPNLLITSIDGGQTWDAKNVPFNINAFYFFNKNEAYGMNMNGNLFSSNDGGNSWFKVEIDVEIRQLYMNERNKGWFKDDNKIYYTKDAFKSYIITNCNENIDDVSIVNPNLCYAIGPILNSEGKIAEMVTYRSDLGIIDDCDKISETENLFLNKIKIWPSQTNDYVYFNSNELIKQIKIVDISGKVILVKNPVANLNQLNLESINPGLYFIQIQDINNTTSTFKIIKL